MSAVTSTPLSGIRALVVGLGSIGATHARVLESLGATVEAVSRRESAEGTTTHASIEAALAGDGFDYCVVASATSDHAADVRALAGAGFAGTLLVEKPIALWSGELPAELPFAHVGVGYNLRFHPAVGWLRRQLEGQDALVVDVAAQSFLPGWRPGRDHRETASGSRARGGGVLRDLSHELDLMLWLFGEPRQAMALGGNLGDLGIDAETAACAVLELEQAPIATLRLSYLDRLPERRVRVTTASDTLEADLLSGECRTSSAGERYEIDWTKTYADLHLAMLGPDRDAVCTLGEGLRVVACIEELEGAWAG